MIPREDLTRIAELLRERDVLILSDEIYSRICYGAEPASITQFDGMLEKTIILDGFSKTYSMTGWRLGYGVMPLWLADAVDKLMVNSNSCTASFTQRAGLAALQGPQDAVDAMVAEFRRRRDVIVKGLNEIPGFRCVVPDGAFYVFPERDRHRRAEQGAGRHAAQRRRRRLPERHGVRQLRRRLPAIQLRHLAGEHPGSARPDSRKVSERWAAVCSARSSSRTTAISIAARQPDRPRASSVSAREQSPAAFERPAQRPRRWRHSTLSSIADVHLLFGQVDDRFDGQHHPLLERQVPVADVVHGHADVVPDVRIARVESVLPEDVLRDLPDDASGHAGLDRRDDRLLRLQHHSYALQLRVVNCPETGQVRVMSIVM